MLFSIQILIEKSIEKLIFPAFGKILVLANAFSIQILIKKVLKKQRKNVETQLPHRGIAAHHGNTLARENESTSFHIILPPPHMERDGIHQNPPPKTRTHQTDPHMPKLWIVHWFKSRPLRWHILHYFATAAHGEGWDPSEPAPQN